MISGTPSLLDWSLSDPRSRSGGTGSFVERHVPNPIYYGCGKVAFRDGLAPITVAGENVLVPAYLPDAVVEPLFELGLEPRYYALEETLAPDLADLETRIDADTAAVCSVNYFGFPQPGLGELERLIDEYDCYHVDDNAHGALSVRDGRILGTRGDLGFTSFWKVLPVPDGAALYLTDDEVRDKFEPSSLAGSADRFDADDLRFVTRSLIAELLDTNATVRGSIEALLSARAGSIRSLPSTTRRYEAKKNRLSKLSELIIRNVDPVEIRRRRRENYRAWRRVLAPRSDVELIFETLPEGICPQVCPVRTDRPRALRGKLERCGVGGVHTWPRLSRAVLDDSAYETARTLSECVLVLPVHQHVDPEAIRALSSELAG
ncbi:DegT/DnrJ/EryC1/StrS family aminotransferase [Natrialbaceae archaeon GCM10025810]|uniref:DegT/DnrJ/EryC1/StrS family aminotransferase n=1 Tax=Halovalidus salilacus TaxID=3075124 RepID=UPI00360B88B5